MSDKRYRDYHYPTTSRPVVTVARAAAAGGGGEPLRLNQIVTNV